MVLLGLLLLAASVVIGAEVAMSNTATSSFEAFGQNFTDMTLGGFFLVGCAVGAAALLGLWMTMTGLRMKRRRRIESKHVVHETRSRVDELEDENDELRSALEREREQERAEAGRTPVTSATAPERDTVLTLDRDKDGVADRSQPATARTDAVYPDDPTQVGDTPTYDETAERTHHRGVLGRLRDR